MEVRVRFAPSPTGYLHVGGARTAIFNWLFAKKNKGKFLLRIEDTDIQRSREEMTEEILESLLWLGINWDEEIVYQSDNLEEYRKLTYRLLEEKKAYRCFCSPEELNIRKNRAKKLKIPYKYDRTCLKLSDQEKENLISSGKPFAIRFLVPEGKTVFEDLVYGKIEFNNSEIEDFILLRSDGTPTYQLAVVNDDNRMGITHIIRGDDHLSNTPKQILLYNAIGIEPPLFAHLPLILGVDKKRLSKRQGAVSVMEFKKKGYLPEAVFNFLTLLGWSPGNDREILSRDEIIKSFSLEGISKKCAVFDEVKLDWMNGCYINKTELERLYELCLEFNYDYFSRIDKSYMLNVLELVKPRIKRLDQIINDMGYFFSEPQEYNNVSLKKYWKKDTKKYIEIVTEKLSGLEIFEVDQIEKTIRDTAEKLGISAAKLIHPVRICLTGTHISPGLFELISVLGKETVIERLKNAVDKINTSQ
ncbi:glutamate--tRNA ligase [candidate division KSB1 bacterium]|nr:MAG: glutamate--tRNA ligase [candidate division KSB1 bacterium]